MMPSAPRVQRDRRYSSVAWRRSPDATLARDGYTCQACARVGRKGDRWLVADHRVPPHRYPGPFADIENLVCLCRGCNVSKGDATVDEWKARTTRQTYGPRLVAPTPAPISMPTPPAPMTYAYHLHHWGRQGWQVSLLGHMGTRWPMDGTCPPDCAVSRREADTH